MRTGRDGPWAAAAPAPPIPAAPRSAATDQAVRYSAARGPAARAPAGWAPAVSAQAARARAVPLGLEQGRMAPRRDPTAWRTGTSAPSRIRAPRLLAAGAAVRDSALKGSARARRWPPRAAMERPRSPPLTRALRRCLGPHPTRALYLARRCRTIGWPR